MTKPKIWGDDLIKYWEVWGNLWPSACLLTLCNEIDVSNVVFIFHYINVLILICESSQHLLSTYTISLFVTLYFPTHLHFISIYKINRYIIIQSLFVICSFRTYIYSFFLFSYFWWFFSFFLGGREGGGSIRPRLWPD